jgi:hypothetical protein
LGETVTVTIRFSDRSIVCNTIIPGLHVDDLDKNSQRYYFQDPVLRFWVANTIRGVEVSLTAEPLDLAGLMARLNAQLQL